MENNSGLNEDEFSRFKKKAAKKPLTEEEQKLQWRKEIDENKALQEYFSQYEPSSVERYIESILTNKSSWVKIGTVCLPQMENEGTEWIEDAFEHLQAIQQKKLFDLQCHWRAEKITIKEVDICYDFDVWQHNVLNCPFIEPVSESELSLYINYLQTGNADVEYNRWHEWQNYQSIKASWLNNDDEANFLPEWYRFHNSCTGAGMLLNLPDIRGSKENYYYELVWKHKQETEKPVVESPGKPILSPPYGTALQWHVDTFENKEIRKLYSAYKWMENKSNREDELADELRLLFEAEETIPISAHSNWKEAIKIAARRYKKKLIADALPAAWEQYMININTGIAFADDDLFNDIKGYKLLYVDRLLKGRELNGEPADLNF